MTDDLAATRRRLFALVCRVTLSRAFFCQLTMATLGLLIKNDKFPDADLPTLVLTASSSQAYHMTAKGTYAVARPKVLHKSVPEDGRANCSDLIQTRGFSSFLKKAHAEREAGGPERYCEGFADPHLN